MEGGIDAGHSGEQARDLEFAADSEARAKRLQVEPKKGGERARTVSAALAVGGRPFRGAEDKS